MAQFAQRSAWHGAVTFILLWLGGLSLAAFIALAVIHLFMGVPVLTEPQLIDQIMSPRYMRSARLLQVCSSIGSFLIPGWIFTRVMGQKFSWERANSTQMALAGLIPIAAMVVVGWLAIVNETLTFPIGTIDEWMRAKEAQASQFYEDFLVMHGLEDLLFNLFMMALIPALGEELLFRAGLQQYIQKYVKSHHVAIWVTAIVFSAIHLQFYTFIPRLVMGAGLGYMFFWGGNIIYPILGHFVNNASAVLMAYAANRWVPEERIENFGADSNFLLVGSMVVLAGLFISFKRFSK